jgi:hypothetical protein
MPSDPVAIDPERLWFEFCKHGIQYYASGRWAALAGLLPVYGNHLHHAVEMFLKAYLARHDLLIYDLKEMRHDLDRLWTEFKKVASDNALVAYDDLIADLDKFEDIRYPDAILRKGMTGGISIVPGDRTQVWTDVPPPPHYEVNLGEIDGLVVKIVAAIGVNRQVLVRSLGKDATK